MILTTMEQHEYDLLSAIQNDFPNLTFQHEPYQEWVPSHFTENDKKALEDVKALLKKSIKGFRNFTNFFHNKKGELWIRIYYDWSWSWNNDVDKIPIRTGTPFTGVGYLKITELLNGFEHKKI